MTTSSSSGCEGPYLKLESCGQDILSSRISFPLSPKHQPNTAATSLQLNTLLDAAKHPWLNTINITDQNGQPTPVTLIQLFEILRQAIGNLQVRVASEEKKHRDLYNAYEDLDRTCEDLNEHVNDFGTDISDAVEGCSNRVDEVEGRLDQMKEDDSDLRNRLDDRLRNIENQARTSNQAAEAKIAELERKLQESEERNKRIDSLVEVMRANNAMQERRTAWLQKKILGGIPHTSYPWVSESMVWDP